MKSLRDWTWEEIKAICSFRSATSDLTVGADAISRDSSSAQEGQTSRMQRWKRRLDLAEERRDALVGKPAHSRWKKRPRRFGQEELEHLAAVA